LGDGNGRRPIAFSRQERVDRSYDGFTKPSMIDLSKILMWIQIHDLHVGYRGLVKTLAGKVGTYVQQEPPSIDAIGNFYRVRVKTDVYKPLKRDVSIIRQKKRKLFLVKYERLHDWCSVCGMLGHINKEHGDGIHPPQAEVFKYLKVSNCWRPTLRSNRGGS
jgi:hypothetical protein